MLQPPKRMRPAQTLLRALTQLPDGAPNSKHPSPAPTCSARSIREPVSAARMAAV